MLIRLISLLRDEHFFRQKVEQLFRFAASERQLSQIPPGSRVTHRQTLIQVWKTTGKKPQALAEHPEVPDELKYLWEWFQELHSGEALSFRDSFLGFDDPQMSAWLGSGCFAVVRPH